MRDMLEPKLWNYIENMVSRYPLLNQVTYEIANAYQVMEDCYKRDGKLLIAGNGGSAADSEHMAGELMKKFKINRPVSEKFAEEMKRIDLQRGTFLAERLEGALTAVPLVAHEAITTAYMNDVDSAGIFAQQLLGYGRKGDVFLAISTSGNSKNILNAAVVAKAKGIKVIGLTGASGGELVKLSDVTVCVPECETYMIQELHLPVYHCWCLMLEDHFFGCKDGGIEIETGDCR